MKFKVRSMCDKTLMGRGFLVPRSCRFDLTPLTLAAAKDFANWG